MNFTGHTLIKPLNTWQKYSYTPSFRANKELDISDIKNKSEVDIIAQLRTLKNYTITDSNGNTILHELARANYFYAVKSLLINPSRTKEIVNIQNKFNQTPLDLAQDEKLRRLLIAKGGKQGLQTKTQKNEALQQIVPTESATVSSAKIQATKPNFTNVFKKAPITQNNTNIQTTGTKQQITIPATTKQTTEIEDVVNKNERQLQTQTPVQAIDVPSELQEFSPLRYLEGDPAGFDDVVGLNEIKDELNKSIIIPLTQEKAGKILSSNSIDIPNGLLFVAPKGNGKTHLAKALSQEAKLPILELTDLQQLEKFSQVAEKLYKDKKQRVILFVRGLENVADNGSCGGRNCNSIARNLSNSAKRGILIVATAQNKDDINSNMLTPGLIDKIFKINQPDETTRTILIEKYINNKPVFENINNPEVIKFVAEHTAGFSVAQLKHVIDESARSAASDENGKVDLPELLSEIKTYSKEQEIPEINEYNKTSMYDTVIKREQYRDSDPQKLADIGGMNEVKEKIQEKIIEPWQHKKEMDEFGIGMPDGVLLYGPPGSGKTFIVKGIARELGLPLYSLTLSKVASSFRHDTVKKIKDITSQLTKKYQETGEASVLFLDELDSLGKAKGDGTSSADNDEVNTLLQELDNAGDKGIVVLAATNKLDSIEGALARDGRLGERIFVGYADFDSRVDMISKILSSKEVTKEYAQNDDFIKKLALDFEEMPSGSIAKVIKEATYQMAIKGFDFEKSIEQALESYKEKELDDILTRKGVKNRGEYLKASKNSTLKYDTTYDRTFLKDNEPQNFDELGGMQDTKAELKKHIIDMHKPETIQLFRENNIPMPGGVILTGPSSNGKTTIVKALSGEMKLPLYELSYDDVADSYIHQTSKKTHEMFNQLAYKYKKTGEESILLLDEIEKFTPERGVLGNNAEYKKEEVAELLSMMNDASDNGIILVGTTNHINQVDNAVKGNTRRMGTIIQVNLPNAESRKSIIEKTLEDKPIAKTLLNDKNAIEKLTAETEGLRIGDIADMLRKGIVKALVNRNELTLDTLYEFLPQKEGSK